MKREHMVRLLAPPSPPCFPSRSIWLSYLNAHAAEQRREHEPGPLVFTAAGVSVPDLDAGVRTQERRTAIPILLFKDKQVSFNFAVGFCEDCSTDYRERMQRAGLCRPNFLTEDKG